MRHSILQGINTPLSIRRRVDINMPFREQPILIPTTEMNNDKRAVSIMLRHHTPLSAYLHHLIKRLRRSRHHLQHTIRPFLRHEQHLTIPLLHFKVEYPLRFSHISNIKKIHLQITHTPTTY